MVSIQEYNPFISLLAKDALKSVRIHSTATNRNDWEYEVTKDIYPLIIEDICDYGIIYLQFQLGISYFLTCFLMMYIKFTL